MLVSVASLPILSACSILFPPRPGFSDHPARAPQPDVAPIPAKPGPTSMPASNAKIAREESSKKYNATLYVRLGGEAGITAFSDDFLGRVTNDPVIIPFFRGLTQADLTRIRQHVIELLCSATGGPCVYSGKDMKTTHKDMEINLDAWNAFTGHLNESVAKFKIPDRERNELVVIIASLKKDIVNR